VYSQPAIDREEGSPRETHTERGGEDEARKMRKTVMHQTNSVPHIYLFIFKST
jgi:hypothetical protein